VPCARRLRPGAALLYGLLVRALGPEISVSLVCLAAAPPIASAAGLCFLLGFNARLAVEITVATTLLTPVLGPLALTLALPEAAVEVSAWRLARDLGLMIAGGTALALIIRRAVGPARIAAHSASFDGVAALAMLVFVFPLFDQVPRLVSADPARAAAILGLCMAMNIGVNLATRAVLLPRLGPATAGTAGILAGNRTVAMYLAALPFDPTFALFVALYQVPMYFTPLLLARLRA